MLEHSHGQLRMTDSICTVDIELLSNNRNVVHSVEERLKTHFLFNLFMVALLSAMLDS